MKDKTTPSPRPAVSDTAKTLGLILPVLLLCVGFLLGLCWFLRPAESETEQITSGGCASVVAAPAVVIVTSSGALIITNKRRRRD